MFNFVSCAKHNHLFYLWVKLNADLLLVKTKLCAENNNLSENKKKITWLLLTIKIWVFSENAKDKTYIQYICCSSKTNICVALFKATVDAIFPKKIAIIGVQNKPLVLNKITLYPTKFFRQLT